MRAGDLENNTEFFGTYCLKPPPPEKALRRQNFVGGYMAFYHVYNEILMSFIEIILFLFQIFAIFHIDG